MLHCVPPFLLAAGTPTLYDDSTIAALNATAVPIPPHLKYALLRSVGTQKAIINSNTPSRLVWRVSGMISKAEDFLSLVWHVPSLPSLFHAPSRCLG